MSRLLEEIETRAAQERMSRGQGTGPLSRGLSALSLAVVVYIAVLLFRSQLYIPLIAVGVSPLVRLGMWLLVAAAAYLLFVGAWLPVGLLLGYFVVSSLANFVGMRNIRRQLQGVAIAIDPLEGAPDIVFASVGGLALFGAALLTAGTARIVLLGLLALLLLYLAARVLGRIGAPWRRVHFPLMFRYSGLAGAHVGLQGEENFNVREVTRQLVSAAYPWMGEEDIEELVGRAEDRLETFSDREWLEPLMQGRPGAQPDRTIGVLSELQQRLRDPSERGLYVRYAVGEIVGREFGEDERRRYMLEVLRGNAN